MHGWEVRQAGRECTDVSPGAEHRRSAAQKQTRVRRARRSGGEGSRTGPRGRREAMEGERGRRGEERGKGEGEGEERRGEERRRRRGRAVEEAREASGTEGEGEGEEAGRWRGGRDALAAGTHPRSHGTVQARRGWTGSAPGLTRSGVAGGRGSEGRRPPRDHHLAGRLPWRERREERKKKEKRKRKKRKKKKGTVLRCEVALEALGERSRPAGLFRWGLLCTGWSGLRTSWCLGAPAVRYSEDTSQRTLRTRVCKQRPASRAGGDELTATHGEEEPQCRAADDVVQVPQVRRGAIVQVDRVQLGPPLVDGEGKGVDARQG